MDIVLRSPQNVYIYFRLSLRYICMYWTLPIFRSGGYGPLMIGLVFVRE